jgi:hypothetical protein
VYGELASAVVGWSDAATVPKLLLDLEQRTADIQAVIAAVSGPVQDEVQELKAMLRGPLPDEAFEWVEVVYDANGEAVLILHEMKLTAEEAEARMRELEKSLHTVTDMSELDFFDLAQQYADYKAGIERLGAIIQAADEDLTAIIDNLDGDE